jgi:hypothetical protein
VERFESNGKPSALLYAEAFRGATRPAFRFILNGHLDVVPGEPEQFRPRRDGDRLYARGAQDMKVSALVQAQVFRELAPRLPYPLALRLVADEEVGGRDGTVHQLRLGVAGTFVVIGEHSGLNIVADSKGLLHATLRVTGRSARRRRSPSFCGRSVSPASPSPSTASTHHTTSTMTTRRLRSCAGLRAVRATRPTSSTSMAPATAGSIPDAASRPSRSVSAGQDSTARMSTSRSPPSFRTTGR